MLVFENVEYSRSINWTLVYDVPQRSDKPTSRTAWSNIPKHVFVKGWAIRLTNTCMFRTQREFDQSQFRDGFIWNRLDKSSAFSFRYVCRLWWECVCVRLMSGPSPCLVLYAISQSALMFLYEQALHSCYRIQCWYSCLCIIHMRVLMANSS